MGTSMNLTELATHGRAYVRYPEPLRKAVEDAVGAWRAFYALPVEQKRRCLYDPDTKTSGNGYEWKGVGSVDLKENFHLRVSVRDGLLRRAALADPALGPAFVEKALQIPEYMAPLIEKYARTAEQDFSIPGFLDDVMSKREDWLFRFLHYFGDRTPGDEFAAPHNDKGGFTLHLYESHPGVERLTFGEKEWVPMDLPRGETVIIAANGLQNRSKGALQAVSHRVVANEETAKTGRDAAVCFFNFANMRFFNKKEFGPQQDFPPGFFYGMPHEEYDRYFID